MELFSRDDNRSLYNILIRLWYFNGHQLKQHKYKQEKEKLVKSVGIMNSQSSYYDRIKMHVVDSTQNLMLG